MSEIDLETRFPELRPFKGLPSLWSVYGIGPRLCGYRDADAETGTYLMTQCFCVFCVPLLALRTFRLANTQQGLLLLGREPVSLFAKAWNALFLSTCLCAGSLYLWNQHITSPEYIAQTKLEEAERLVVQKNLPAAAEQYQEVLADHPSHAAQATAGMQTLLRQPLREASLADSEKVLAIAIDIQQRPKSGILAADIEDCALAIANRTGETDPAGTVQFLNAVAPAFAKREQLDAACLPLLLKLVELDPQNSDFVSQLALLYERSGELEKCPALLEPCRDRLGHFEGARILGQIESRDGRIEQAVELLSPYVAERLPRLREAEKAYMDAFRRGQEKVIDEIKQEQAPAEFYHRARLATPDKQNEMVRNYVEAKLQSDVNLKLLQQRLMVVSGVVPAALELGMLRLNRAQAMPDADARRLELEEAEKTLLAIQGMVGEADEFRVNLGKVYYWLGRPDDGKKLFDELLEKHQRGFQMLLDVSQTLFYLGAVVEARTLSEEAYNKAGDEPQKRRAAVQRSLTPLDNDDQLTWLERSDQSDPEVKALLQDTLGDRALAEHRDQEAISHFRQSLQARVSQVENPGTLNNSALTHFKLFQLTGDRQDYSRGVERLDRAVKLNPSNGILLSNTASALLNNALMEIIGDAVDLKALKLTPGFEHLPYLYDDAAGFVQYVEKARHHAGIGKALEYLERVTVVMPKRPQTYTTLRQIHWNRRNLDALRSLLQRVESVQPDLSEAERGAVEYYSGQRDEKYLKEFAASAQRYDELTRATRNSASPATFAVAAGSWLKTRMSQTSLGVEIDLDELVNVAEEAHARAPSASTRNSLYLSLLHRASHDLARTQPAYAALIARSQRTLGSVSLLAVVVAEPGELREAAAANADVLRAVTLILEEQARTPHRGSPWDWAMVRTFDVDQAARIADAVLHDEVRSLDTAINEKLSPANALQAYYAYWTRLMQDRPDAAEPLKRAAEQGIPLPFDPPE